MINLKHFLLGLIGTLFFLKNYAQTTRVAILDFVNNSGVTKYDGLGISMSNMLITDIMVHVSSKRVQLVERSQIQKVLKEQKFQASGSVNKHTVVQTGKLLGVNYLLMGDIFILKDQLIINARLTNTETGEILFSKKQEGKIDDFLALKTKIAMDLSESLSLPLMQKTEIKNENSVKTTEDTIKISEESLVNYSKALVKIDNNQFKEAEKYLKLCVDIPDKYILELEKKISRNNFLHKYDFVISKIKQGKVNCEIVNDINACSNFGVENKVELNANYNLYLIDEKLDKIVAEKFLKERNDYFNYLGLTPMNTIVEWQDFMFGRFMEYNKMLQLILSSPNIPDNCSENIKEVAIGCFLTFFNDYTFAVTSRSKPERNNQMQDIYKSLYTKLLEINPNSSQLRFFSFKEYKKWNDAYMIEFNKIVNGK
jgi:TolB-like protein